MAETEENQNDPFIVNDLGSMNSDKIKKLNQSQIFNKQTLMIAGIVFSVIILLIILIIVLSSSSSKKKKIVGDIKCIYNIDQTNVKTQILGTEFQKKSDFSIYIDKKKMEEISKGYEFSDYGEHEVIFELYEDINMDYMFKDIRELRSVEMNSIKNAKILSLKSTFEDCTN